MSNGFLYVIISKFGSVKVGVSKNPKERLKQIQTANVGAEIYFISNEVGNSYDVERKVHADLEIHSVGGEWFSCHEDFAVSSILKNIDLYGLMPKKIELDKSSLDAEIKIQKWKSNGCALESVSISNYNIVEEYLEIDKSPEFALLSHEQQYLIASTNLANAFINAHMNGSRGDK